MKPILLLLLIVATLHRPCAAQEQRSETDSIYSKVLQQKRPIQIVYPQGYDPADKYELLYCLDGLPNALKMETAFLQSEGFIPQQLILIGIPPVSIDGVSTREHDFSPTVTSPNTGGAPQFLQFLKTELLPYLQQKLHAKATGHSLYGASMGGLFAAYVFLNEPKLFTSYLAIDPSLWWGDFHLQKKLAKKLANTPSLANTLWVAGREGNAYKAMGIAGIDSLLRQQAPATLQWKCVAYANETHYSTMLKGFWDGMKFSYGGFYASTRGYPTSQKITVKPTSGIVLKDKAFPLICSNLGASAYIRFASGGSEPVHGSKKLSGQETQVQLAADSKIVLKSFGLREEYNRTAKASFKIGKTLPALQQPANAKQGGLRFSYFKGNWTTLPDFAKLKADSSGSTGSTFNINDFKTDKGFACLMEGFLEIEHNGYYIFTKVEGNDYSKVYLGQQLILGSVNGMMEGNEESYILPLQKGFYPFKIVYWRKKEGKPLQPIYIKPEGQEDFPIKAEMLYN